MGGVGGARDGRGGGGRVRHNKNGGSERGVWRVWAAADAERILCGVEGASVVWDLAEHSMGSLAG